LIPVASTIRLGMHNSYAEQFDDIGRMLVRAKIITAREVRRQGVRFALRDRLEPPRTHACAKRTSKKS